MHIVEVVLRAKDGNVPRTLEWWKEMVGKSGAYKDNGEALSRMDGENSVVIVRHRFEDLAAEGAFWNTWHDSEAAQFAEEGSDEYVDAPPTFHRYAVLHSY
ncbi:MAG: hypothetical protein ACPHSD_19255 [Candidatus Latescibacterota bacterium]|jgi:hypothetical protein